MLLLLIPFLKMFTAIEEGRGQKEQDTYGIQTPPVLEPLNKSLVGVLNPTSLWSRASVLESEFPSAFCLLPSAFPDN